MFDNSKLRGRIYEKFGSQTKFAEALGVTRGTINNQLNSPNGLSQSTITKWSELLEIPANEIGEYFFKLKEEK